MSTIQRHLEQKYIEGRKNTWLIGDAGYPLQPWLLTPITDAPPRSPEGRYTACHVRTRNTIERCFGVLKQRFRCLLKHRVLHYSHGMTAKIIYVCAILHNMCVERNIELDGEEETEDDENSDEDGVVENQNWYNAGRNIRNSLINQYFS